jgi:hypothetical protein
MMPGTQLEALTSRSGVCDSELTTLNSQIPNFSMKAVSLSSQLPWLVSVGCGIEVASRSFFYDSLLLAIRITQIL